MGTTSAGTGTFDTPAAAAREDRQIEADYFGSRVRAPQPVLLTLDERHLQVRGCNFVERFLPGQTQIGHRSASGRCLLQLPDGALLDCPADCDLERWLDRTDADTGPARGGLRRWRTAATVALALAAAWLALPATAEHLVDRVPAQVDRHIGRELLSQLDTRWVLPSQLPATTQQDLRQQLGQLTASRCPTGAPTPWDAQFRARGRLGAPAAFGLPGGTIVITDDRVPSRPGDDPALLDTLCQELQQMQRRQGLRTLARQEPLSLLLGLFFDDFSATVAVAWPVLSRWLPLMTRH